MTSILYPEILLSASAFMSMAVLYAVAVRSGALQPSTVNPFHGGLGSSDPSADTLSVGSAMLKTTPPAVDTWQVATLNDLSQVQDLLDSLENHGIADREVVTLSNDCFCVRWR